MTEKDGTVAPGDRFCQNYRKEILICPLFSKEEDKILVAL